jgi:hypothetical protein
MQFADLAFGHGDDAHQRHGKKRLLREQFFLHALVRCQGFPIVGPSSVPTLTFREGMNIHFS